MIQKLKTALSEQTLPGDDAHLMLSSMKRVAANKTPDLSLYRTSAVLILLYKKDREWHNVLIQRPKYEGKHSNQIAFPGGKKEEGDDSTEVTALREAQEEIGIHIDKTEIIGKLSRLTIPVSLHVVHPYVAIYHGTEDDFEADQHEVDGIITYPIKEILTPNCITKAPVEIYKQTQSTVPCFIIQDKIVWGATSMMLNELRLLLLELKS